MRELIANFPPEVSEVAMLSKLEDKESAAKLAVKVRAKLMEKRYQMHPSKLQSYKNKKQLLFVNKIMLKSVKFSQTIKHELLMVWTIVYDVMFIWSLATESETLLLDVRWHISASIRISPKQLWSSIEINTYTLYINVHSFLTVSPNLCCFVSNRPPTTIYDTRPAVKMARFDVKLSKLIRLY